jgi:hypothetical protein
MMVVRQFAGIANSFVSISTARAACIFCIGCQTQASIDGTTVTRKNDYKTQRSEWCTGQARLFGRVVLLIERTMKITMTNTRTMVTIMAHSMDDDESEVVVATPVVSQLRCRGSRSSWSSHEGRRMKTVSRLSQEKHNRDAHQPNK